MMSSRHSIATEPRRIRECSGFHNTHSLRRTKATLIHWRTKNLRAVQLLLGQRPSRQGAPICPEQAPAPHF
jgi:hypothetical protein